MATIIVKNGGGTSVDIDDLGISIPATSQRTLVQDQVGEFTIDELDASQNLYDLVNAGTLVLNDGSADLSSSDGITHVKIDTDWEISEGYYDKTELNQSGGGGQVHWDNVTNAPSFGTPSWKDPVVCRVEEQSSSGPGSPTDGMFYLDTDDGHLYKRVTGSWVDQGAPSEPDGFIDKSDEEVYMWSDSTAAWILQDGPEESDARIVGDDGDGESAQYVFNGTNWIKLSDVDWGDHGSLVGLGDDDHTQYHNDTRGDARYYQQSYFYDTSQGSQTAILADATGKIDISFLNVGEIVGSLEHHDLGGLGDDDHTQYHTDARGDIRYYKKTEFFNTSQGSATGVWTDATGKIDISFLPDGTIDTVTYQFGRGRGQLDDMWLYTTDGAPTSITGPRMPKNMTIVGMSVQTSTAATATFYIRKNGAVANLGSVALAAVTGNHNYALNIDVNAGDWLGVYMDVTSGKVSYPVVQIFAKWR